MCTNMHYIYNKYIHKRILVPCGKCPACLQQKADIRTNKIRNHFNKSQLCLFVTLTYDNLSVPVIRKSEISENNWTNIYRGIECSKIIGRQYISDVPYDFKPQLLPSVRTPFNPFQTGMFNHEVTAVSLYSDLQKFFKRLRINLNRNGINTTFQYYACSEYGAAYKRPHFHVLFFIDPKLEKVFRVHINEAWPFADSDRLRRSIEVAKHPADYVSSYVNCFTGLPKFFQLYFKPKHSASIDFGKNNHLFQLPSLLRMLRKNSLAVAQVDPIHFSAGDSVCVPKYVINRYFPIFKGYSRIAPDKVYDVLLRPALLSQYVGAPNEVSSDDVRAIKVSLRNHYYRYCKDFVKAFHYMPSYFQYCQDFKDIWNCYNMTKLRLFYEKVYNANSGVCILDNYDNCNEVSLGLLRTSLLDNFSLSEFESRCNYNALAPRKQLSRELTLKFIRKDKQRKVTNSILSTIYDGF